MPNLSNSQSDLTRPTIDSENNEVEVNTPTFTFCRSRSIGYEKLIGVIRFLIVITNYKSDNGRTPNHELCKKCRKDEFLICVLCN